MKKLIQGKNIVLIAVLVLIFCFGIAQDLTAQEENLEQSVSKEDAVEREDINKLNKVQKEIITANLINGLYLSDNQMEILLVLAKKAKELRQDLLEKCSGHFDSLNQPLEELKDELIEDKGYVSEETKEKASRSHGKISKAKSEYEEQLGKVTEEAKAILTENQLYLIEHFKPCIIPPKGPMRIGQASDYTGIADKLDTVRKMSEEEYYLKKDRLADKVFEKMCLRKPEQFETREEEVKSKILLTFDKARSVSDLDFEIRKEELVKEFKESISPQIKPTVDIDKRIQDFLLDPTVISVLEEKIKRRGQKELNNIIKDKEGGAKESI